MIVPCSPSLVENLCVNGVTREKATKGCVRFARVGRDAKLCVGASW